MVDEAIYCRRAILQTCYWFTDRCYIFVSRHDSARLAVRLKSKGDPAVIDDLVGEFENALIDNQLRAEIQRETATLRDLIVAKAFAEGDLLEDPPVGDDSDPVEVSASDGQTTTRDYQRK